MPQLSIDDAPSRGYAGQFLPGPPKVAFPARAESGAVAGGMPVKRGTNPEKQCLPFAPGDVPSQGNFYGVVLLETSRPSTGIEAGDSVSVLRFGSVLMDFSEAVTAGEQVGLVLATGLLTGVPQGTAAGALATGTVVLPGLRIAATITAAGRAAVEVNMFGAQDAATVGSL